MSFEGLTLTNIPAAPYLKLPVDSSAVQSVTRGLVGDTAFAVLPNITPRMTFVLTLAAQIVSPSQSGWVYPSSTDRFSSLHSSSSSSDRHGPISLQLPLFAPMLPSSSVGTSTRKPSYWSLFPSASSRSTTAVTSAPSDLSPWQATSVYSLCSLRPPSSLSRLHTQSSGSLPSYWPSTDWHQRKTAPSPILLLNMPQRDGR